MPNNFRAKGKADAEAIRAAARAKRDKINAFASQRAEDIRAEGEAQAATYLKQMGEHEELAIFLAWLDAVKDCTFTKHNPRLRNKHRPLASDGLTF